MANVIVRERDVNFRRCLDAVRSKFACFAPFDYQFLKWMFTKHFDPITRWALFQAAFGKPTAKCRYLKKVRGETNYKLYGLFRLHCHPEKYKCVVGFDTHMFYFLSDKVKQKLDYYKEMCNLTLIPKVNSPLLKVDQKTGRIDVIGKYAGMGFTVKGSNGRDIFSRLIVEYLQVRLMDLNPIEDECRLAVLESLIKYVRKNLHEFLGTIADSCYRKIGDRNEKLYAALRKHHEKDLVVLGIYKYLSYCYDTNHGELDESMKWVFEQGENPNLLLTYAPSHERGTISEFIDFDKIDELCLQNRIVESYGDRIVDVYLKRKFDSSKLRRILNRITWNSVSFEHIYSIFRCLVQRRFSCVGLFNNLPMRKDYDLNDIVGVLIIFEAVKCRIRWFELVVIIKCGNLELVQKAVGLGADLSSQCIFVAHSYGKDDIVEYLQKLGCPDDRHLDKVSGIGAL